MTISLQPINLFQVKPNNIVMFVRKCLKVRVPSNSIFGPSTNRRGTSFAMTAGLRSRGTLPLSTTGREYICKSNFTCATFATRSFSHGKIILSIQERIQERSHISVNCVVNVFPAATISNDIQTTFTNTKEIQIFT